MENEVVIFANGILTAIGQPALTIIEAEALPEDVDPVEPIYSALAEIINGRAFPDNGIERLNAYAVVKGVDFTGEKKVVNNIFIGARLEN